jgi:hypothetical protein
LRIACVTALCCTVLLVIGAVVWNALDRRPAWVMAVTASAQGNSAADALSEERRALAAAVRTNSRAHGPVPAFQREAESRDDAGRTFIETRTILLRSDDQMQLLTLYRTLGKLEDVHCTDPARALRPADAAFALLVVAFLFGLAALEPSRFEGEHASTQPALVVLNGIGLGLVGAAAILVGSGWPGYVLHLSFALALVPTLVWLIRIRVTWNACAALRLPYRTLAAVTAIVFCAWVVRATSL